MRTRSNGRSEIKDHMAEDQVRSTVKQEQLVFDTRRKSFQTQINALEQLKSFLEKEVVSLEKQLKVHEIEVDSVKAEYEMVEKLYKKGLTAVPRKLALQRNMAQVDGERLRLRVEPDAGAPGDQQDEDCDGRPSRPSAAARSRVICKRFMQDWTSSRAARKPRRTCLYETEVLAPQMLAAQESAESLPPVFKILRKG